MDNKAAPPVPNLSTEQLMELAQQVLSNQVFGTWNIKPQDFNEHYPAIFLPIMNELPIPTNAGAAYEFMSEALDESKFKAKTSTYPVFMTVKFLSDVDAVQLSTILRSMSETSQMLATVSQAR